MSQHRSEWHLLSNHRNCICKASLSNEIDVSWHIDFCWTSILAWNKVLLSLASLKILVHQRACGTNFNAGSTELAIRLFQSRRHRAHERFATAVDKIQCLNAAQFSTRSHTARTVYAQVVVSDKQGFILGNGKTSRHVSRRVCSYSNVLCNLLELAVAKLAATTLSDGHVCGTRLACAALFLSAR
jgi:hypothetical protein